MWELYLFHNFELIVQNNIHSNDVFEDYSNYWSIGMYSYSFDGLALANLVEHFIRDQRSAFHHFFHWPFHIISLPNISL